MSRRHATGTGCTGGGREADLVTGAAGFIGANVARRLVHDGFERTF